MLWSADDLVPGVKAAAEAVREAKRAARKIIVTKDVVVGEADDG